MQQNAEFPTTNPHSEHFEKFENEALMQRLQKKFTPAPYWHAYRLLRVVVLATSFVFNVLSAATASVLVFFFTQSITGSTTIAGVITVALMAALELTKRETSGRLFLNVFQFGKFSPGLAAAVVGLTLISTASSYFGAKRAVKEFTPAPTAINADSLTGPMVAQLATIDAQVREAGQMKWKGKTTVTAQRTIERLSRQKENVLSEITRIRQRADGATDAAQAEHSTALKLNASQFAMFTATCEILLILCLFYLEYYDYRSFAEHCKTPTDNSTAKRTTQTQNVNANVNAASLAGEILHSNGNGNGKTMHARADVLRATQTIPNTPDAQTQKNDKLRSCAHCGEHYTYGHARQRFCSNACRVASWEASNGKKLKRVNVPR